uniref:C-type lectin domain-containing protein n=1 Tax=Sinocyclocheilus rhinocerous TaxID=307959 RepID=A0A673L5J4_9TELE
MIHDCHLFQDSNICAAAIHAGVVLNDIGGDCTLLKAEGQNFYSGSTRNGIVSRQCSGPDWFEFGEFCYKPFEEKKTWHSARTACRQLGADLVSIRSMTEQSWLESYLYQGTCWIGLSYHWSDGTPVSHTNWGHGEPNNHNGRENCVEMVTTENGTSWWNDLNCDAHQDWICMIAKGKKPIIPPEPPSPVPGNNGINYYQ